MPQPPDLDLGTGPAVRGRVGDPPPALASSTDGGTDLFEQRGFPGALFDAIPNPLLVVDSGMKVLLANRHMTERFSQGLPIAGPSTGMTLRCSQALSHPEGECGSLDSCGTCQLRHPAQEAIAGVPVHRRECEFEYDDGGRTRRVRLLVSAAPFQHRDTSHAVVILEDITELEALRGRSAPSPGFAGMIGVSPAMQEVFETIRDVANLDVAVLIQGESGTGKELVARAIHSQGVRAGERFVPVNCGAIPEGLLESELFGHAKGAFTGAVRTRKGRFELAHRGTIFLDEIGDISPAMQVKLLRVLQEGTIDPVGSERHVQLDVRVVSASNRDLAAEVAAGRFREDLFYRLSVVPITVPPLRDRLVDLPLIADHLVSASTRDGETRPALSSAALAALLKHPWPGNIRELHNALQFATIKSKGGVILPEHLPSEVLPAGRAELDRALERQCLTAERVAEALERTDGNRTEAARALGVSRATLYRFLEREPVIGPGGQ